MYRPGDLLSDHLAVFVWSGAGLSKGSSNMTATSHYEKLAQSACKQASGDRLWCGSCHDPHDQPRPAERAAFFRSRCLSCHQSAACKESMPVRRKVSDDCAGCHMPKSPTQNMEHVAFTDHAIPRRPGSAAGPRGNVRELVSFFGQAADGRDLALAYAIVAATEPAVRGRALELLKNAESAAPDDVPLLSQMAQFYDRLGDEEKTMDLCERITRLDPANHKAATNLAIYWIKRGRAKEAIALWENVLTRSPGLTGARINLAVAEYRAGNGAAAEAAVRKALEYDPDNDFARKLLYEIRGAAR
jgi:predicted CXXCH cytochrome family protein